MCWISQFPMGGEPHNHGPTGRAAAVGLGSALRSAAIEIGKATQLCEPHLLADRRSDLDYLHHEVRE
jgi:hypothetical protein